jgi:IclR family KDG regulon transcriptional repressor
MAEKKQALKTHGSLEKGLGLLSAFIPDNREIGTVELANLFSMNRSTVSRMLTVLKRQGFVTQNPENRKYSLGPYVVSLASAYRSSFESTLTQFAKPYLDQLRRDLDQTVVLEIPSEVHAVVAYVSEGFGPVKIAARIGDKHNYHSSAGGKCMLAFSDKEFIERILQSNLPSLTPRTIVEPSTLEKELAKIRKNHFSFDEEGNNAGISAFAVPILNNEKIVVAAILTAGPSNHVTWKKRRIFVEKLQSTASKICSLLITEVAA